MINYLQNCLVNLSKCVIYLIYFNKYLSSLIQRQFIGFDYNKIVRDYKFFHYLNNITINQEITSITCFCCKTANLVSQVIHPALKV